MQRHFKSFVRRASGHVVLRMSALVVLLLSASAPLAVGVPASASGERAGRSALTVADRGASTLATLRAPSQGTRHSLMAPRMRQQAYLKASNTNYRDMFGINVALSGDTLVVGAPGEDSATRRINGNQDDNSAVDAGAVYVFVRSDGQWKQQAYLKASNADAGDAFGRSLALFGDVLVVGAPGEDGGTRGINGNQDDNSAADAGAAYVFVRSSGEWTQQAYLKASNADAKDNFGNAVALSDQTIVVAAYREASAARGVNGNQSDNSLLGAGAAYVFVGNNGDWTQQAYLKASNSDVADAFGHSLALSGDTLVVGAPTEDGAARGVNGNQNDNSAADAGAAYVFVRSNGEWAQQAYLKPSNTDFADHFAWSIALLGNTLVVGAPTEASAASGVNGNQNDNSMLSAGAAYVFVRNNGTWTQQAYLKASNTDAQDVFGISVALSGEMLVVAAFGEGSAATGVNGDQADNSVRTAGAAYVFVRNNGTWTQYAYLKASNPDANDYFGSSVALAGNTLLVGAYGEGSAATGVNGDQADDSVRGAGAAYAFVLEPQVFLPSVAR